MTEDTLVEQMLEMVNHNLGLHNTIKGYYFFGKHRVLWRTVERKGMNCISCYPLVSE